MLNRLILFPIRLITRRNLSFYQALENPKIAAILKEIDTMNETIRTFHTDTDFQHRYILQKQVLANWSFNSLAIEGSSLTLGDTIMYLNYGLTNGDSKPLSDYFALVRA